MSLPINLTYASNGVRVDDIASWVGMGWNIQAGGVVTRIAKGHPDEITTTVKTNIEGEDNPDDQTYKGYWMVYDKVLNTDLESIERFKNHDTQPDEFFFTVNGINGSFYINPKTLKPIVSCDAEIKVQPDITGNKENGYNINGFTITTQNGVVYKFGYNHNAIETITPQLEINQIINTYKTHKINFTIYDYLIDHALFGKIVKKKVSSTPYNNSWYLTQIYKPGFDTIDLEYVKNNEVSYWQSSQMSTIVPLFKSKKSYEEGGIFGLWTTKKSYYCCHSHCSTPPFQSLDYAKNKITYQPSYLNRIISDKNIVELHTHQGRPDMIDNRGRLLNKISIKTDKGAPIKSYLFAYDLIQAKDLNVPNFRVLAEQDLDGDFFAEPNGTTRRIFLKSVTEKGQQNEIFPSFTFSYISPGELPYRLSYKQNFYGYYMNYASPRSLFRKFDWDAVTHNIISHNTIDLGDYDQSSADKNSIYFNIFFNGIYESQENKKPPIRTIQSGMLSEISYPAGRKKQFDYLTTDLGNLLQTVITTEKDTNMDTISYSYSGGAIPYHSRRKFFNKKILGTGEPFAYDHNVGYVVGVSCEDTSSYTKINTKGNGELLLTQGGIIGFKHITQKNNGNGRIEYTFKTAADEDNTASGNFGTPTNKDKYRGLLTQQTVYTRKNTKIQHQTMTYHFKNKESIKGFNVKLEGADQDQVDDFNSYQTISVQKRINEKNQTTYTNNSQHPVTATTSFTYDSLYFTLPTTITTTNGIDTSKVKIQYVHQANLQEGIEQEIKSYFTTHNIIAPFRKETVRNNIKIGEQQSYFEKGSGQEPPYYTSQTKTWINDTLKTQILLDQYDSKGRLLEYHNPENNIPTAIKYNERGLPQIKAENANYNDIADKYTTDAHTLPNAYISTAEYDELFRINKMTSHNQITQKYQYDKLNRLSYKTDKKNNLTENYRNNYREKTQNSNNGDKNDKGIGSMILDQDFWVRPNK